MRFLAQKRMESMIISTENSLLIGVRGFSIAICLFMLIFVTFFFLNLLGNFMNAASLSLIMLN